MVKRNYIDTIRFWELLFQNQLKNAMQIRQLAGGDLDRHGEPEEEPPKDDQEESDPRRCPTPGRG
jgi:hypothetical protein